MIPAWDTPAITMSHAPPNARSHSSLKYSRLDAPSDALFEADGAATQPLRSPIPATIGSADADTDANLSKLRRVADSLPPSIWIITVIEMCERFAYLGIAGPLQNYVQNASDDPLRPGGLGEFLCGSRGKDGVG